MKAWIVLGGEGDYDYEVRGVYATKELARNAAWRLFKRLYALDANDYEGGWEQAKDLLKLRNGRTGWGDDCALVEYKSFTICNK